MDLLAERLKWLESANTASVIQGGLRGIEKESLRVDGEGRLSQRAHPKGLGSALSNRFITTDYSEALLEFITPVSESTSRRSRVNVGWKLFPGSTIG